MMRISLALFIGFAADAVFGDPHTGLHPVVLMGHMITALEKWLRSVLPKTKSGEIAGGAVLAVILTFCWTFGSAVILRAAVRGGDIPALIVESFFWYLLVAAGSLRKESMKVCTALETGDTEGARRAVSMIVGRDTKNLTEEGITKAAIETVAENTSDGVIAPMLYMAVFGAPGAFFYKSVNTMDSMLGYKNEQYLYFGRVPARLDDIVNFLPARISGLLLCLSAGLCGLDGKNAFRIWKRDRRKHASPNAAHAEAAVAGALHVQLAGDAYYFGKLVKKPVIGDSGRPVIPEDIRRADRMMEIASVLFLLICAAVRTLLCLAL